MNKPLELTVHEIDRADPSMVVVKGFWEYRPYDPEKRLTDAELAAEVHSQREAWAAALYDDVYSRYVEDERSQTNGKQRLAMGGRAVVLHRFATLPHYDEVV